MKITIKNLYATSKDGKDILKNFSMNISDGETHVIMGPNGTGKSTLSKVIMGSSEYITTSGDIIVENESIMNLTTDERAKKGIFLAYQNPISIDGITNSEFLRTAYNSINEKPASLYQFIKMIDKSVSDLEMKPDMIHRSINKDFSGGERKKNEILQMKILTPQFIILDELDSGLDVDSLKIVCENINKYLEENKTVSVLIITHYPKILEYLHPDFVHVMKDGKIIKTGDYNLAKDIEKNGYSGLNDMEEELIHE